MTIQTVIRVLIADDQIIVREGLASLLDVYDDLELVGQAHCGMKLLTLFQELEPDVVLLDVKMSDLNGIDTLVKLRRLHAQARVIMLTNFNELSLVRAAVEAGARGYLLKDVSGERLAEAIRRVMVGEPVLDPAVTDHLMLGASFSEPVGKPVTNLTRRELAVLNLIADGQTNAEIAYRLGIKPSTVKTYLQRIMEKLNASSRMEAVRIAIKQHIIVI